MRNFAKKLFHLFLLLVLHLDCVQLITKGYFISKKLDIYEVSSKPVFNVIVNKINNEIIIGGRNAVYRLSSDPLLEREKFTTEPVEDDLKCLSQPESCTIERKLTDNDNKILLILYDEQNYASIFACGGAYQGICFRLKADNFLETKVFGSVNDSMNFIGSKTSGFAFFDTFSGENVLKIAHSYDGIPNDFGLPLISLRKLNGEKGFVLYSNTSLDLRKEYKQSYKINFLYGFTHKNQSYFLSTQKDSTKIVTKLIRLKRNEESLFVYSEIQLICSHLKHNESYLNYKNLKTEENVIYHKASTAFFAKIDAKKYNDFEINDEKESHILFVAFVKKTDKLSVNDSDKSSVCAFNMIKIEKSFDTIEKCFTYKKYAQRNESFLKGEEICEYSKDENNLFDGNIITGINQSLFGIYLNTFEEYITSIAITIQESAIVAVVGTRNGKIMKVLFDKNETFTKVLFEINISEEIWTFRTELDKDPDLQQIHPNPAFDREEKNLYLLTARHVVKLPISSCSFYKDCPSCLDSSDPLRCGWCNYYCATFQECDVINRDSMSWSSCMPKINHFTPKYGPLSGNTSVSIDGNSWGEPEIYNISATIAGVDCQIKAYHISSITCITGSVDKEISGPIEIKFKLLDITGNRARFYENNGTVVSEKYFSYTESPLWKDYDYDDEDGQNSYIIISVLIIAIILFIIIVAIIFFFKYRSVDRKIQPFFQVRYNPNNDENLQQTEFNEENSQRTNYVHLENISEVERKTYVRISCRIREEFIDSLREDRILIDRKNFILQDSIGQGNYGCVYKGILEENEFKEEIAVKTLNNSFILHESDIVSFLKEGLIMKDLNHCNVLKLRGICFGDDSTPIILLPYMERGDLLSFIREMENILTVEDLSNFALGIASGMQYLSRLRYVHRDLAARNCLLDSKLCVKIADFGLSRDIYEKDYYRIGNKNCRLPVKWMSPESLERQIFNTKTDVWSYGVVVWELFTRGITPYFNIECVRVLNHLKEGNRLAQPNDCPESIYLIICKCWSQNPKSRPNFDKLYEQLQQAISQLHLEQKLKFINI